MIDSRTESRTAALHGDEAFVITREVTRLCRECNTQRDVMQFDFTVTEGRQGRRRYCLVCRPEGSPWPQVATFPVPADPSFGIKIPSVAERIAVILACWDDCCAAGPLATARMLNQVYEVVEQTDPERARQMRRIVAQVRAGEMALGEARRVLEGMG